MMTTLLLMLPLWPPDVFSHMTCEYFEYPYAFITDTDSTPGGGGYGQNIADSGSTGDEKSKNPADLVSGTVSDMWYNGELSHFLPSYYGQPDPEMSDFENWGHFSQVVWKGTTTVGCASQFCASGDGSIFTGDYSGWFTVCNYGPAGNVGGGYAANVGTLKGNPTVSV
jgi:hypothetical protein